MAVKNIYKTKEKEKSIYSSSNAANSSHTAAASTQNVPQNNVWNAGQSTPLSQSSAVQKPKREKSPSELGEEVVRLMLEEDAQEARQPAAAATAAPAAAPVTKTIAGNKKAAPYTGTAASTYPSSAYAASARQLFAAAPERASVKPDTNAVQNMAYDKGIFDLTKGSGQMSKQIDTLPNHSYIGAGAGTVWDDANSNNAFDTRQNAGEDAGPTSTIPDWLALMSTSDSDYPGLTAFANQVGFGLKDAAAQFAPDTANSLALDWLDLMSTSNSDYPGLPTAANQIGFGLKESAAQFTPDTANSLALDWLDLMSMSNSDYPGLPTAANQAGFWVKDNAEWIAPEWLSLMSMSNSDYPGLPVAGNQLGFLLKDKAEQLWEDTHLAPGTSFDDYLKDKFRSGIYSGTEGAWNGLVDHGELYEKGWLLTQNAEMQGQSLLNDAYREQTEHNNMQTREVLDTLLEYSEGLRSHKAAEYAQYIDELYDTGGLCRFAGDFISSLGKMIPSILVEVLTGDIGKMGYLYLSIEGNAAAEARAGGADEDTALLYGMLSSGVKVAIANIGKVITTIDNVVKLNDKTLNEWMMGMVQSDAGCKALRHLEKMIGSSAKTFITKITEIYFARMWNDDERGFWQTIGETMPDVIYQELIGTLVNSIFKVSPDTMPSASK